MKQNYSVFNEDKGLVKAWIKGVPVDEKAVTQLKNSASMPFIYRWLAAMPDCHWGMGSTVGSVIPTQGAIIPAAVGVDIGCGMMAVKTSLLAKHLPDNLKEIRSLIESVIPHGRTNNGGVNDRGAWNTIPTNILASWSSELDKGFYEIIDKYPKLAKSNNLNHLGTLGTGNHFIEVCLDEKDSVWIMLHSGSRGIGNKIGNHFIQLAKKDMERYFINLPDKDLAYFPDGSKNFNDYMHAVSWAQKFAKINREIMMENIIETLQTLSSLYSVFAITQVVNCHHNYVAKENHYGNNVWITRKGAVRAREGDLGIIPGSMGEKSYIVEGKGNPESFNSCSHGAGRIMSRTEAKKKYTIQDLEDTTRGVECRKDADVIDEIPNAYKPIDLVMQAQGDLVSIKHTLKQVVCVKG